jgi:hypothetical protein
MRTRAERLRDVIAACEQCVQAMGKDLRTPTERVEQLWFAMDDQVEAIEQAEANGDDDALRQHLLIMLELTERIERELPD